MTPTREVLFRAALDHYKASRPREAAELFEDLLKSNPDDTEALLLLAVLRMDGDPDAAEMMLTRCVALAPKHSFALHNLGKLQQRRGDHWAAIQLFRKAAAGNANFPPTFNDLGASLHQVGEREAALAAVDQAIAIDPEYTTAHTNRGFILLEMQRPEDARQAFRKVLASTQESADAWHNFGTAHYNLGEFEQAIDACRQALLLDPSHLGAYSTLAQSLHRVNRAEEAERVQTEWARRQRIVVTRCRGEHAEARILLVGAAEICNVPPEFLFDRTRFETVSIYLLPAATSGHDLVASADDIPDFDIAFNAVGDADRGAQFLDRATSFCRKLDRPILNPPDRISQTRRDLLPSLLSGVPGLAIPTTRRVARADISLIAAETVGIDHPLLLRPIGSHGGDDLVRVENCSEVAAYLETVPAQEFYLSDFWDFRSADGYFRKYRLIFVDREVYPYHLAIGRDWLVHYWRADMVDWKKQEEETFLADFRSVFCGIAAEAVMEVARRLDLDYAGMDCAILADGRVLLFEANATMLVHLRESQVTSAYKHAHVPRIVDAMTDLVLRRTGARTRGSPIGQRPQSCHALARPGAG